MATRTVLRPLRRALLNLQPLTPRTPPTAPSQPSSLTSQPSLPQPLSTSLILSSRLFSTSSPFSTAADAAAEQSSETSDTADALSAAEPTRPVSQGSTVSNLPLDVDWTRSYFGLASQAFAPEVVQILSQPLEIEDIEVKPDGVLYLPEIKYRRILQKAFGPGGWGLVPKAEAVVGERVVTREYVLVAEGRFISQAQGENSYFSLDQLPSAVEGCKSNALMRCCKDLGVASELWDPIFVRKFKRTHARQVWVEHVPTKKKKQIWIKKGETVDLPYKLSGTTTPSAPAAAKE